MAQERTIVGNLTRDIKLTASQKDGKMTGRFAVAVQGRERDDAGEWHDAEPEYFEVQVQGPLAEHAADTLRRGHRVIVTGTFEAVHRFTGRNGEEVAIPNYLTAKAIGPDLKFVSLDLPSPRRALGGPEAPQFHQSRPAPEMGIGF